MAVGKLDAALEDLTKLLQLSDAFNSAAEDQLQQLKTEFSLLKSFLEQAPKMSNKESFQEAEQKIDDAASKAQNIISPYLQTQKSTGLSRILPNANRVNLAKEIKSLRENYVKPALDDAKSVFDKMRNDTSANQIKIEEQQLSRSCSGTSSLDPDVLRRLEQQFSAQMDTLKAQMQTQLQEMMQQMLHTGISPPAVQTHTEICPSDHATDGANKDIDHKAN